MGGNGLKNELADKIALMRYALIHNHQDLLQLLQMKNLLIPPKDIYSIRYYDYSWRN